jgi:hypothetical protein
MIRFLLPAVLFVTLYSNTVSAEDGNKIDQKQLGRLEKIVRTSLAEIEEDLSFERINPSTLVVNYHTRKFMVHGQMRGGRYAEKAYERVGPTY